MSAMTPKQAKRMAAFLKAANRLLDMMDHKDVSPFVRQWNGSPNIRANLIEFCDWHSSIVARAEGRS